MMAQYSKFIPSGAIILNGSGSTPTLALVVFSLLPRSTLTVLAPVIQNTFSNDVYVTVSTSSGQEWSGNVPTESVVTWVLPAV